jgi:hypothetical protein
MFSDDVIYGSRLYSPVDGQVIGCIREYTDGIDCNNSQDPACTGGVTGLPRRTEVCCVELARWFPTARAGRA